MATDQYLRVARGIIGYQWNDERFLKICLTAAGADEQNHDGNRALAQMGDAALQFLIVESGSNKAVSRGRIQDFKSFASSKEQRASAARRIGLERCIRLCELSGPASVTVLSSAISAIIGGVWKDSKDLEVTARIVRNLTLLGQQENAVNPAALTMTQSGSHVHVAADIDMIFDENWTPPLPLASPVSSNDQPESRSAVEDRRQDVVTGLVTDLVISENDHTPQSGDYVGLGNSSGAEELASRDPQLWDAIRSDSPLAIESLGLDDGIYCTDVNLNWGQTLIPSPSENTNSEPSGDSEGSAIMENESLSEAIPPFTAQKGTKVQIASKKRSRPENEEDPCDFVKSYIVAEQKRCAKAGMPGPNETFLGEDTLSRLDSLGPSERDLFFRIAIGICSPETVATLQATIASCRTQQYVVLPSPGCKLSATARFNVIKQGTNKQALNTLLLRCHTLQLYEEHPGVVGSWFNVDPGITRRPGNPLNRAEAAATRSLTQELFPNLDQTSQQYQRNYFTVRRLRKLGRRLHKLKMMFGIGVLALIQCSELSSAYDASFNITDQMFLTPTEKKFDFFLALLEASQGPFIKRFSSEVAPIMKCVMEGTLGEAAKFPLESVKADCILESPKNSETLLSLIKSQ